MGFFLQETEAQTNLHVAVVLLQVAADAVNGRVVGAGAKKCFVRVSVNFLIL
jgi:hypothetical protein